jgi:prepilin-type N-terminal cleavage/methylation domain-containing protein
MTSPTSANRAGASRRRGAFTLVEMLVVVGILAALIAILAPMTIRLLRSGEKARAQADLQSVAAALEAFYQDFDSTYPSDTSGGTKKGSQILLEALMGPGDAAADGADGFGRRKRGTQGKVYGPYLPAEKWKYTATELQDRFGNAILYVPARPAKPNINDTAVARYIAGNDGALWNTNYLESKFSPANSFNYLMGDTNTNGQLNSGETAAYTGPYLLWGAGGDGQYGIATLNATEAAKCDDVTNFR